MNINIFIIWKKRKSPENFDFQDFAAFYFRFLRYGRDVNPSLIYPTIQYFIKGNYLTGYDLAKKICHFWLLPVAGCLHVIWVQKYNKFLKTKNY